MLKLIWDQGSMVAAMIMGAAWSIAETKLKEAISFSGWGLGQTMWLSWNY
jgi:hypothetical protein